MGCAGGVGDRFTYPVLPSPASGDVGVGEYAMVADDEKRLDGCICVRI